MTQVHILSKGGDIVMDITDKEITVDLTKASVSERELFDKALGRTKCARKGNKITIRTKNPHRKATQLLKLQGINQRLNFKLSKDGKTELVKGRLTLEQKPEKEKAEKYISAPRHQGGC